MPGRGVLLDIAAFRNEEILEAATVITLADFEAAEARQGVRVGEGDILLFRTGLIRHFTVHGSVERYWKGEPGIDLSCVGGRHERGVAAIASDNWSIEAIPPNPEKHMLPVHCVLIRDLGMTLGEIFDLESLAEDCAEDGVWEFFFTAPVLKVVNGVGSPITPLAFK